MYGQEHYLSKIGRNENVLDKAPENVRGLCLQHIIWARELSGRLDNLEYAEREAAIQEIHKVLDSDYVAMGFELPTKVEARML